MRINSVSQLSSSAYSRLSDIINTESYIEMSQLSGTIDDTDLYLSYKMSMTEYSKDILSIAKSISDYIDEKVAYLSQLIDSLSVDLSVRLDEEDMLISNFINNAHDKWFVHKSENWPLPDGTIGHYDEYIYGKKIFLDTVHISGANSLLTSDNVIEGTSRRALWS